jgi:hypothetical protein
LIISWIVFVALSNFGETAPSILKSLPTFMAGNKPAARKASAVCEICPSETL